MKNDQLIATQLHLFIYEYLSNRLNLIRNCYILIMSNVWSTKDSNDLYNHNEFIELKLSTIIVKWSVLNRYGLR